MEEKTCKNCLHKKVCMNDRKFGVAVFPPVAFGTYEERSRLYEKHKKALEEDCPDWVDINLKPRKQAEWIKKDSFAGNVKTYQTYYKCSRCKALVYVKSCYCNKCGAEMVNYDEDDS